MTSYNSTLNKGNILHIYYIYNIEQRNGWMGGLRRVQMGGLGVAMVCRNGWMGGWIFFTNHDSIYGQVVRQRSLRMLAFMLACECQFSWLASSLCRSYEAKSLQMKKERSSENIFQFQKSYEVIMKQIFEKALPYCV